MFKLENFINKKNIKKYDAVCTKINNKYEEFKKQESLKDKDEVVIFITNENNYNKYTKPEINTDMVKQSLDVQKNIYDSMTVFEKWIYFLFKKDIR